MNSFVGTATVMCFLVIQVYSVNPPEDVIAAVKECGAKFGIDPPTFWKGLATDDQKCVYSCVQTKGLILTEAGEFTIDAYKAKHPSMSVKAYKAFQDCSASSTMKDPCDSAKAFHLCITKIL